MPLVFHRDTGIEAGPKVVNVDGVFESMESVFLSLAVRLQTTTAYSATRPLWRIVLASGGSWRIPPVTQATGLQ